MLALGVHSKAGGHRRSSIAGAVVACRFYSKQAAPRMGQ
jgi:hypothetical protein